MKRIIDFYSTYDEDARLAKDPSHRLEFITTIHVLDPLIGEGACLLDVGAGTGAYSFHYAQKGHAVVAVDPAAANLDRMKMRLDCRKTPLNMTVAAGDGRDLSCFEAGSFDVVLCMGPLYHLATEEDRLQCIGECLRVLRRGGIFALSYISRYAAYVYKVARGNRDPSSLTGVLSAGAEFADERDIFYFLAPGEVSGMMRRQDVDRLEHVSTDGIGALIPDVVNGLSDEEYASWLDAHLDTCREPSILGYSLHALFVGRKK